jgi:hypothetical protein
VELASILVDIDITMQQKKERNRKQARTSKGLFIALHASQGKV